MEYVAANQLGGVMIWEMSSDLDEQLIDALTADTSPPTVPALPPAALGLLATLLGYTAIRRRASFRLDRLS